MTMKITQTLRLSASLVFAWAALGLAQGPAKPKDDALDDLLKKVEETNKPKDAAPAGNLPGKPGEVAPKDKDLDSLLEKLGQTKDAPSPDGKKPEPPPAGGDDKKPDDEKDKGKGEGKDEKDKGKGEGQDNKPSNKSKPKPSGLAGEDKALDEHLEELGGKKKKSKSGEKPGEGQGKSKSGEDGPLGDLIKQMREVEERLGKPDTGEQTRQKQTEIVKRMDTLIEQIRQSKSQQQAMRMMRQGKQPGKPGQEPGQMAQGPPPMRPEKPQTKSVVAKDKNVWGHLPPDLRAEMDNVFNEQVLPSREDLIRRYYLAVSKKSLSRGD